MIKIKLKISFNEILPDELLLTNLLINLDIFELQ